MRATSDSLGSREMLQTDPKNRGIPLQVISSTTTAATSLASMSLVLSSLIGTLVGSSQTSSRALLFTETGDPLLSLSSTSVSSSASSSPSPPSFMPCNDIPVKYVQKEIIRGGLFWCIGLRAIYFPTSLLLWIFGPIPMFVSSMAMEALLNVLDTNTAPLHQFQSSHSL